MLMKGPVTASVCIPVGASVAALVIGLALGTLPGSAHAAVPRYEQVRTAWLSSDVTILDRHGEPVQRVRRDYAARRGEWVALADV